MGKVIKVIDKTIAILNFPFKLLQELDSIGYVLALLEMKLILGSILTEYKLTLASDRPVLPKRCGGIVAPNSSVPIILKGKCSRSQKLKTEPIFSQT